MINVTYKRTNKDNLSSPNIKIKSIKALSACFDGIDMIIKINDDCYKRIPAKNIVSYRVC